MSEGATAARSRRIEYRPRVGDNIPGMSIFTGVGLVFLALFVFTRAWDSGWWTIPATGLLVLGAAGLPWAYLLTAVCGWTTSRSGPTGCSS